MKNYLVMLALLFGAMFTVGCDKDPQEPDTPVGEKPVVAVEAGEVTETTFTFTIVSSVPGDYAYYVSKKADNSDRPTINDWFTPETSGAVEGSVEVTITDLVDNTDYELFVVVRGAVGDVMSDVKKQSFTTLNDGQYDVIEVVSTSYNTIVFNINLEGNYLFYPVAQEELDYYGATAEEYVVMYGIYANGFRSYEWIDGEYYEGNAMHVKPGREYTIIAVNVDNGMDKNVIGEFHSVKCTTPSKPQSEASVAVTLSNITSTTVTIALEPNANVASYYVYVRDKSWVDTIIAGYGEEMLAQLILYPSSGSWYFTAAAEETWTGLLPNTENVVMVYLTDTAGAVALSMETFTTADASGSAAEVDAELKAAEVDGHKTLELFVSSDCAASVKYAFNTTADVNIQRNKGLSDASIAASFGADFDEAQMRDVNSVGVKIALEDLWPEVEYTAIVLVKTVEQVETVKTLTFTTESLPIPARVESDLFTSLIGEWTVSYDFIDYTAQNSRIEDAVVTIAAGVDDKTNADYRAQNRLVILDWPFQPDYEKNPIATYTPQFLMESSSYWRDNPALAYRDYGPKVFLEIAEGDKVTMPTAKNMYFYNWDANGYLLNFYGCDYANKMTAPAPFPVEVKDGGDTIVIGAYQSGEEFGYGLYRPSVFRNNQDARCVATSDIILKRVK